MLPCCAARSKHEVLVSRPEKDASSAPANPPAVAPPAGEKSEDQETELATPTEEELEKRADAIRSFAREESLLGELPTGLRRKRRGSWRLVAVPNSSLSYQATYDEPEAEETPASSLDSLVAESLDGDGSTSVLSKLLPMPVPPRRIVSEEVKGVVNKVLMPHLIQKNVDLQKARTKLRNKEISTSECRMITRNAGRDFDLKYASTIRAAKELANETGEVPIRKLVSSDESWNRLQQYAQMSGVSLQTKSFKPEMASIQSGSVVGEVLAGGGADGTGGDGGAKQPQPS